MTYASLIPFVLIISLILIIAVVMAMAISNNYRTGLRFREGLTQRIKFLRLDKMLKKRNIKREHYLHIESVANIENQIRNCESCSEIKQCDQVLKESSSADLSFCPNDEDFELIANKSNPGMKQHRHWITSILTNQVTDNLMFGLGIEKSMNRDN